MNRNQKLVAGMVAAASLMITATVYAHPGGMGQGVGEGGMGHRVMGEGAGHGHGHPTVEHGMGDGAMRPGHPGSGTARQMMTPEERAAMQEKVRSAKTPEERQQLAEANRAEMQKRAKEKGIALPKGRGPGAGIGAQSGGHKH